MSIRIRNDINCKTSVHFDIKNFHAQIAEVIAFIRRVNVMTPLAISFSKKFDNTIDAIDIDPDEEITLRVLPLTQKGWASGERIVLVFTVGTTRYERVYITGPQQKTGSFIPDKISILAKHADELLTSEVPTSVPVSIPASIPVPTPIVSVPVQTSVIPVQKSAIQKIPTSTLNDPQSLEMAESILTFRRTLANKKTRLASMKKDFDDQRKRLHEMKQEIELEESRLSNDLDLDNGIEQVMKKIKLSGKE